MLYVKKKIIAKEKKNDIFVNWEEEYAWGEGIGW